MLLREFDVRDAALRSIAEIVHDVDLKEAKFGRPETSGVDHLVTGIAWSSPDDDGRVAQATVVFDALHAYFKRSKQ